MATKSQYEFSDAENEIVRSLARNMKFVGLLYIAIGVLIGILCGLTIIDQPILGVSYFLQTVLLVIIGVWVNNASSSFKRIVDTTGQDIQHLMMAFDSLRKLYRLQFMLLTGILLLFVVTLGVSLVVGIQMNVRAMNSAITNS